MRRRGGWLFVDFYHQVSEEPLKEVHCVKVPDRKRLGLRNSEVDMNSVERFSEIILIEDIYKIRSPK